MSHRMAMAAQSRWMKVVLALLFFLPPLVSKDFDPAATPDVVQAVLAHPLINESSALMVLGKYALLVVPLACFFRPALLGPLAWAYYAVVLVVIAVGQNIANTDEFGWAWLAGNTALQLVVAAFVAVDVFRSKTRARPEHLHGKRLWVLAPMALAWLFPYGQVDGHVVPGVPAATLVNEAGLTYCMVTPVILGLMILFSDGVHLPTLRVAAWVGLLFGIVNATVWFVLSPLSWWMGILHIPLLVLSAHALWLSRRRLHPRDSP